MIHTRNLFGFLFFLLALTQPVYAELKYRAVDTQEERRSLLRFIEEDGARRTTAIARGSKTARLTSFGDPRPVLENPRYTVFALVEETEPLNEHTVAFFYALSQKGYVMFFTRFDEDPTKSQTMNNLVVKSFYHYLEHSRPPRFEEKNCILAERISDTNDWLFDTRFWQTYATSQFAKDNPDVVFGVARDDGHNGQQAFELRIGTETVYALYNPDGHKLERDRDLEASLGQMPAFPPQSVDGFANKIPSDIKITSSDPFIDSAANEYRLKIEEHRLKLYKEVARRYLQSQNSSFDPRIIDRDLSDFAAVVAFRKPYYVMTAGLPAAGKSSLRRLWTSGKLTDDANLPWAVIDLDELKEIFTELEGKPKTDSAVFHTEAGIVAAGLSQLLVASKQYNLWIEGTFRWSGFIPRLRDLEKDFQIALVYAYADDLRTLLERAANREAKTGRGVPLIAMSQPSPIDNNVSLAAIQLPFMPIYKFASKGHETVYGGLDFLGHTVQPEGITSFSPAQMQNVDSFNEITRQLRYAFASDIEKARGLVHKKRDAY